MRPRPGAVGGPRRPPTACPPRRPRAPAPPVLRRRPAAAIVVDVAGKVRRPGHRHPAAGLARGRRPGGGRWRPAGRATWARSTWPGCWPTASRSSSGCPRRRAWRPRPRARPARGRGDGDAAGEPQQRHPGRAGEAARGRPGDGPGRSWRSAARTAPSPRSTSCWRCPASVTRRWPRSRPSSRSDAGAAAGVEVAPGAAAGPARGGAGGVRLGRRLAVPALPGWTVAGSCVVLGRGARWGPVVGAAAVAVRTLVACLLAACAVGGRDRAAGRGATGTARWPGWPSRGRWSTVTGRVTAGPGAARRAGSGRTCSTRRPVTEVDRPRAAPLRDRGAGAGRRRRELAAGRARVGRHGHRPAGAGPTARTWPGCCSVGRPPRVLHRPGELFAGAGAGPGRHPGLGGRGRPGRPRAGPGPGGRRRPVDVGPGRRRTSAPAA